MARKETHRHYETGKLSALETKSRETLITAGLLNDPNIKIFAEPSERTAKYRLVY